jgi:hypothetical protein
VKLGRLEARTMAPQAAMTKLLVAGLAEWVRFVRNRWQVKSLLCAWLITYESRDFLKKEVALTISIQGKTMLSLLKGCESCIQ